MRTHEEVYDDFIHGHLGKDEWTHEAHLITGWVALQKMDPASALGHMRDSIKEHNCGVGIQNTAAAGYHETMTVYFLTAIDAANASGPEELFDDPATQSSSPLTYWSKDRLMSSEARLGWCEPDIAPLPWSRLRS